MIPDRLFNYLDGKLPEHERRAVEEELMNSAEARREFEVARRIHSAAGGGRENLEIFDETTASPRRGRLAAQQILLATLVLVAVNVGLGLLYIAHHEASNPNRALLENQSREQLRQALEKTAAASLTPPPLGLAELHVTAQAGHAATVADEIVQLATRLNGSATKGIPDDSGEKVLVEIAAKRGPGFEAALRNLGGISEASPAISSSAASDEKISLIVQVSESK
jgi:anti-sigma factor RsiW